MKKIFIGCFALISFSFSGTWSLTMMSIATPTMSSLVTSRMGKINTNFQTMNMKIEIKLKKNIEKKKQLIDDISKIENEIEKMNSNIIFSQRKINNIISGD